MAKANMLGKITELTRPAASGSTPSVDTQNRPVVDT